VQIPDRREPICWITRRQIQIILPKNGNKDEKMKARGQDHGKTMRRKTLIEGHVLAVSYYASY
jgi:hypothetical protein